MLDAFSRTPPVVLDTLAQTPGVLVGMTAEEALPRRTDIVVIEADEPAYRAAFNGVLASLQGVSDREKGKEYSTWLLFTAINFPESALAPWATRRSSEALHAPLQLVIVDIQFHAVAMQNQSALAGASDV